MKIQNLVKILSVTSIALVLTANCSVFAAKNNVTEGKIEFSQEFLEWEKLDESEKAKTIMPRMYNVTKTDYVIENPFKVAKLIGGTEAKFDLNTYIKDNLVIKNQGKLGACWAFSSLAALETNLALQNYNNGLALKLYDFSERHMEYTTSRVFKNNVVNELGFERKVGSMGNIEIAMAYLTNGSGAISEKDMPYVDTTELIDINEIKGKEVISQIYDTVDFPSKDDVGIENLKQLVKNHIKNYGGVVAYVHEANEGGTSGTFHNTCPNVNTGALYCNNANTHLINHGVTIIGWNDDYSIENFQEGYRPTSKGAWIAKDSHGANADRTYTYMEFKKLVFEALKSDLISHGITSADQITDEQIINVATESGYEISDGKIINKHNDNGYLYISYEDANVYSNLFGIIKASDKVNYDNIYQYNESGTIGTMPVTNNNIFCGTIFSKKTSGKEYLNQVSITTPETVTCKVYVNPKGSSKSKSDLQLVQLKEGESETFDAGYHTLEFLNPIEITGNEFAVIVDVQGKRTSEMKVSLEFNYPEYYKRIYGTELVTNNALIFSKNVKIASGKCFITSKSGFEQNAWDDLSKISETVKNFPNSDLTIKAFTVNSVMDTEEEILKNIEITTPPTKTKYIEGQNFDKTGMVVKANYNNGNSEVIEDYNISNGSNLNKNQTSVTISYEDKTVNQPITVEENSTTKLEVVTNPTKLTYKAGQNFDKTGMVVKATYKDGTSKNVTDYTVEDGNGLKNGQTYVTITYNNSSVKLNITVEPNALQKIEITKEPTKTKYVAGQNFDKTGMVVTATYEDGTKQTITNFEVIGGTNLNKDTTSVTIKYEDKTATQNIVVEEKQMTSITVSSKPTKTQYIQNKEDLELAGGKIKAIYNDGTSEEILMIDEDVKVTGFDNKNIGDVTITVEYKSKTTTFNVSIIKEVLPENSNFEKVNSKVNNVKYFTFSDTSKKEYLTMSLEINNITKSDVNDGYEYCYYLSANQEEDNIEKWIKISEEQKDNNKLAFTINTKDIENYGEIANSDVLYVYIKEVAKKGGNQSVMISKSIKIDGDYTIEKYLDNNKISDVDVKPGNETGKDNTVASGKIPQTGAKITMFVIVSIIALVGIYRFIIIRKMKDIK